MTTRDKGITLPFSSSFTNVTGSGLLTTDVANNYTVKRAWGYYPGYIQPVIATTPDATAAPIDFLIKGQNANAGFAAIGGAINLISGIGSVGNASGNVLFQDTSGNGGSWNTTHPILGIYHIWFDTSARLRFKGSAPANALDGTLISLLSLIILPYSPTITIDASTGNTFSLTATNNVAFTINAPTNPSTGQRISLLVRNTSGGALGAITWNAAFKMSAWTSPATAFSRSIDFLYTGANWIQVSQTGVDIPN